MNEIQSQYNDRDIDNPVAWLERQSDSGLRDWLRLSLWTRNSLPLVVPTTSRLAIELSDLINRGSSLLKTRVRSILPGLFQEWGRNDFLTVLDDLLIVAAKLRCANSEQYIALILAERLGQRPGSLLIRQRALSVLSGFGCTERSVLIFERHITDIEYAAICYRALYRYDLRYGATELTNIIRMFQESDSLGELDIIIRTLASDLEPADFTTIITKYLEIGEPNEIVDIVEVLRGVGVLTAELLMKSRRHQRRDLFKTLLHRCAASKLKVLLWQLESIGVGLISGPDETNEEFVQTLIFDPTSGIALMEAIIPTSDLKADVMSEFVSQSETIAMGSSMVN